MTKKVCVVIVTFNGSCWVKRNIESLLSGDVVPHIIVVDNNSRDSTIAVVEAVSKDVEIIRENKNYGFGVANNIGISRALQCGFEYIFLLNQDAYVLRDTVSNLMVFLDERQEIDIVSPLHCSPDINSLDEKTFRGQFLKSANRFISDAVLSYIEDYYLIYGVNAAAWFARSSLFERIGGFDPLFHMYGEDDDLIERFHLNNVQFAVLPSARFVHLRESPKPSEPQNIWTTIKRLAERQRSDLIVKIKNPLHSKPYMLRILVAQGFLMPSAEFLLKGSWMALFASWLAFLRICVDIPRITRHARLTFISAPHFLNASQGVKSK